MTDDNKEIFKPRLSLQDKLNTLAVAMAPDILAFVGGDPERINDLVELLQRGFDYVISENTKAPGVLHPPGGGASTELRGHGPTINHKKEDLP